MRFEDYRIAPEIKKGLAKLGYKRPTDIQFKAIPSILKGDDVLAIAQTGTGKTAAFAIPVINSIHNRKSSKRPDGIKCLVMVPTHELAIQVNEVFNTIGKYTKARSFAIFGGVDQDPQIHKLQKGVDILVATPGRMFDLIHQGHLRMERIEILILDEADHMLERGFLKDIQDVQRFLPKKRQTLFFSATIDKKIKKLAYSLVNKPIRIQISPKDPVSKNISHGVCFIDMDHKRFFLERMVREYPDSKILAFVRTKVRAERVMKAMERVQIKSETLHGDRSQSSRINVLNRFRSGENKLLIATDVSARGIDISDVDMVINYDLPDIAEQYIHRIGRTGRGKRKGEAVSFCAPEEKEYLLAIQELLNYPLHVLEISELDYKETLEIELDQKDDYKSLMKEIDSIKKKNKKKK